MPRTFVYSLLLSILIVGALSGGIAWLLKPVLPFWPTLTLLFVGIFAGAFVWNSQRERRMEVAAAERLAKEQLFDQRNMAMITCPCNQNTFPMPVYVSEEASYVCDVCKNRFNVNVILDPILQTDPVNLDTSYQIFQQLKEKGKEQQIDFEDDEQLDIDAEDIREGLPVVMN